MLAPSYAPNAQQAYRQFTCDGSVRPYPGAAALVGSVRKLHPGGANVILIGLMPVPGYKIVQNSKGIIAVLIGLLLPAVRRMEGQGSSDVQSLRGATMPGGGIGIVLCDGSVRALVPSSFIAAEGRSLSFDL